MKKGYIKIHRQILESEIWNKPPHYLKVWMYLLTKAQYEDYRKLKRGQLFTSIKEIQECTSWQIGYRTEKISRDQVFNVLEWMRKSSHENVTRTHMITTTKATQGMLITIENYEVYQGSEHTSTTMEASREQWYANNIKKEDKEVRNIYDQSSKKHSDGSSYSSEFETFWKSYPRKIGKKRAYSLWMRRLNYFNPEFRATAEELIRASENYAKYCDQHVSDKKYMKHPSTFLSDKLDYEDFLHYEEEPKKRDYLEEKIYKQLQGEWIASGRGFETDEDILAFEEWVKKGGKSSELYSRKSTDWLSANRQ